MRRRTCTLITLILALLAATPCSCNEARDRAPAGAGSAVAPTRAVDSKPAERVARWREDLRFLDETLAARHENAFHRFARARWQRAVERLAVRLPRLDDAQTALALARLVARLGDAHTRLGLPPLPRLPLALQDFDDGIYVVAIAAAGAAAHGRRVLSLGGKPIAALFRDAAPYVPADNRPGLRLETPAYLILIDLLRMLGAQTSTAKTSLVVAGQGGKTLEVELPALTDLRAVRWAQPRSTKSALHQQRPTLPFWNTYLPAEQSVYFRYRSCVDPPRFPMARFAAGMLAFIDRQRPRRVVIDLRGNRGGNSEVLRPMLDGLAARRKTQRFAVAVLIDRGVFSSALLNALELKRRLGATLVGEPTSGKPNHYGEVKTFRLPRSRILVQYATKFFRRVDGAPPALEPDVRVPLRAADFFANKDLALEAALRVRP